MQNDGSAGGQDLSIHVLIKDINRGKIFYETADYHEFLVVARNHFNRYGCQMHTFSLLPDHVHLLLSVDPYLNTGAVLRLLYREYTDYFNLAHRRIENTLELGHDMRELGGHGPILVYYRYLELTPVHRGLVDHPAEYPWSGYACNAMGEDCGLLVAHPAYLALGSTDQARRKSYRETFEQQFRIRLALAAD